MNEQNPKLEKIMNKVPGGLIISGIMWLIMCILIIAGMYLIKYPHFTYISVIYRKTRSHTDNFGENNVKCLIAKGICRFVPHSSAGGF